MNRESFIFYRSFYEASMYLSDEDKWKLFEMICQYGLYWKEIEWSWPSKWMFMLIKPQLDANNKRYENWCLWWAPKWNKNAVKDRENTSKQPKNNQKQPNDNVNDKEKENKKESNKSSEEFKDRIRQEWFSDELIQVILDFDKKKKKWKMSQMEEKYLKKWIKTLRECWNNKDELMIKVVENSIINWWTKLVPLNPRELKNNSTPRVDAINRH